jgi:23S rRNA pseudouridine955/2504/2580 synthase
MREINIGANEAGQRLDKLLAKYLREAPKSFFYKMMRKKNITLNGKKAQGNEMLVQGDVVKLFLAEDTILKFQGAEAAQLLLERAAAGMQDSLNQKAKNASETQNSVEQKTKNPAGTQGRLNPKAKNASGSQNGRTGKKSSGVKLDIVYEDDHIILINKPAGMLSQKAQPQDVSLVEYLIEYLLESGSITREELLLFRPAVCNRLDRNTSGLVVAGKSLTGLQTMSALLKDRSMRKYYRCIVKGTMTGGAYLKGYLTKDTKTNKVSISKTPRGKEDKPIETEYRVITSGNGFTMLEVHLITGRSHQIRAHLASVGHPILGDVKYGEERQNRAARDAYGVHSQLLHAYRLEFPKIDGTLSYLSGKNFCAELPMIYYKVLPDCKSADN